MGRPRRSGRAVAAADQVVDRFSVGNDLLDRQGSDRWRGNSRLPGAVPWTRRAAEGGTGSPPKTRPRRSCRPGGGRWRPRRPARSAARWSMTAPFPEVGGRAGEPADDRVALGDQPADDRLVVFGHALLKRLPSAPGRDRRSFCGFCRFCGARLESPMRGARLPVAASGGAATAAPARDELSRYPTRTAPAAPGHVHTHLRPSPAATSPPWPSGKVQPASGLGDVRGDGWPSTGSSPAGSHGMVAAEIIGGRGRWRR